jgi:hypothetical protein
MEWSLHRSFVQMYNKDYIAMVKAGWAIKLSEPMWVNEKQQATDEENTLGQKATHILINPDYVVFMDEVGCNTQVKKRMEQEEEGEKIVSRGTVEVPCMVCNTKSGSITSDLLVSFLKHLQRA